MCNDFYTTGRRLLVLRMLLLLMLLPNWRRHSKGAEELLQCGTDFLNESTRWKEV